MADHSKILPRPLFRRDVSWDAFREWTEPNRLFEQDYGLPPFLEPGDVNWIDWARKRLASSPWPGYMRSPLFTTSSVQPPAVSSPRLQRQLSGGVSEIRTGQDSWKISLDVNHFTPEEITITTKNGFLEIAGKHEERQDEHGTVSRCFTRKYRLPSGVDLTHISSSLSGEGVLSVEAPLPGSVTNLPGEIMIPIQMKQEQEQGK